MHGGAGLAAQGGGADPVLEAAAFRDVRTLEGGLRAWEEAEDDAGLPSLVVDEDGEGGLTGAWV